MTASTTLQLIGFMAILIALSVPLGAYMARVYTNRAQSMQRLLGPFERTLYRCCGVRADETMSWSRYTAALLIFNLLGIVTLFALQLVQRFLPYNPDGVGTVPWQVALNTAVSFGTNTNWQCYGGEATLSHASQFFGLAVQNFLSAATGMAVLVALIRGLTLRTAQQIGNFWVDLTRSTLYILLPLALILAVALVSQGVVQTLRPHAVANLIDPLETSEGVIAEQPLALGPVASQISIKQLGTNGGGFYNVNAAHPYENPTPLSNLLELLAILLIPIAQCFAFGSMVRDRRQGIAILAAMLVIFLPLLSMVVHSESLGNPLLHAADIDASTSPLQSGGNLEGKEVRFGTTSSALWAAATTAASNGSVNSMHDSFLPLGGLVPMVLIQLGEVVFGGVGAGLYGMLIFVLLAVFMAGLMVGRTPEYLGKKVDAFEIKMAMLAVLAPAAAVLIGSAIASVTSAGTSPLGNPGVHGFSEILYAFSSGSNNNGSAFAGLTASGIFYALAISICMLVGRYGVIVAVLAIAGSLAAKKTTPPSGGTLPTHTLLFVTVLVGVVLLVGALSFIPALALGPIVEHLQLFAK